MKNTYLKTAVLIAALLMPLSAQAGWPVFDVSKTAGLIVNLLQRYGVSKKHIERVKEITEKIKRYQAQADAWVNNAYGKISKSTTKMMNRQAFSKFGKEFEYEKAALEGKTATEVSEIIWKEFFSENAGKNRPNLEEKKAKSAKRKALIKKMTRQLRAKALYAAFGGVADAKKRAEEYLKMFNEVQGIQDSINVQTHILMNKNYTRIDQLSLSIAEFESEMAFRIGNSPFDNYKMPEKPDYTTEDGGFVKVKAEADVDLTHN